MGRKTQANKAAAQTNNSAKSLVIGTLIVLALVVLFVTMSQKGRNDTVPAVSTSQIDLTNQPVIGDKQAPVTVVEFGDYKCPACKVWGERIYPQLKKDYIDHGKVKFAYINVLFHGSESELASLAAESVWAQNEDAYWIYHQAIFDAQPTQNHDGLWVTPEKLIALARSIPDIDVAKLEEELRSKKAAPQLAVDTGLVQKYKVQRTPTIMVNGTIMIDPFNYNTMKALIDRELGGK